MGQFIKMCCIGMGGMLVQLISFNLLIFYLSPALAIAIAIECAIITNFFLHNCFTFHENKIAKTSGLRLWLKSLAKFNGFSLISMALQIIIMHVGSYFLGTTFIISNLLLFIGMALGSLTNFLSYRYFVWKGC